MVLLVVLPVALLVVLPVARLSRFEWSALMARALHVQQPRCPQSPPLPLLREREMRSTALMTRRLCHLQPDGPLTMALFLVSLEAVSLEAVSLEAVSLETVSLELAPTRLEMPQLGTSRIRALALTSTACRAVALSWVGGCVCIGCKRRRCE